MAALIVVFFNYKSGIKKTGMAIRIVYTIHLSTIFCDTAKYYFIHWPKDVKRWIEKQSGYVKDFDDIMLYYINVLMNKTFEERYEEVYKYREGVRD